MKTFIQSFFIFLLLIIIMLYLMPSLFLNLGTQILGIGSIDINGSIWYEWYVKRCIFTHNFKGLYHTNFIAYPTGKNLIFDLGFPLIYLFSILFRTVFKFPTSYNLFLIILVLINAFAFFFTINYLLKDKLAALIGSIFFSINPYIILQSNSGRPEQVAIFWFPLFILFLSKIKDENEPHTIRNTISAALILIFTTLSYWYYGISLLIFTFIFSIYGFFSKRSKERGIFLKKIFLIYIIFVGAILILFSIPLIEGIRPLGYKVIKPFPSLPHITQNKTLFYFRYLVEETSLNLIPTTFLAFVTIIFLLSIKLGRISLIWLINGILFFILSLGPYLHSFNKTFPLPYIFFYYLVPSFPRLWWPINCFSVTLLCSSLLLSYLIHNIKRKNIKIVATLFITLIYLTFYRKDYNFNYGPFKGFHKVYYYLREQPECAIIELPFNKVGMDFFRNQIIHRKSVFNCPGYAIKEYLWPRGQLNLLKSNPLLDYLDSICSEENFKRQISEKEFQEGLRQLYNIGFRFIVINPDYLKNYEHKEKLILELKELFKKPYKNYPDGVGLYKLKDLINE